jgi:HrpA-like RNA helicase
MLNPFGTEIAFQTRFEKSKSKKTRLLFLTDGLLIRQMGVDPLLSQYNVIILDEVHERHVSGDLLVALMKIATQRRGDFKLILMSATIQLELFTKYFEGAPVIKVPGRLFPIEVQWIPVKEHDIDSQKKAVKLDTGPYLKILQMIDTKYPPTERGDLLIFLNGISEMSILAESIKEYAEFSKRWIVLMLHSTLSVEEQNKVFDISPPGIRKAIISTNIAETSVTIDEIRFVIDSGKANLISYDQISRSQRLSATWISKASSEQRKGRAGRTGPGVCYRLYSQDQYEKMDDYTVPEVKRISLESLALQILNMNLKIDVRDFPYLESPNVESLNQVMENFKSQHIVHLTDPRTLSPTGQILASLPVDLVVGKMLIYGVILGQIDVTLTVAAGLSVQSPFTQRSFREFDCIQKRQNLISDMGDPFTLVKVYKEWLEMRRRNDDTKPWVRKMGIEETRLYEIIKLRRQFKQILEECELLSSNTSKELETLSSRERKIKVGQKRQLFKLREEARRETRKRRLLKQGRHFDTILDEESGKYFLF